MKKIFFTSIYIYIILISIFFPLTLFAQSTKSNLSNVRTSFGKAINNKAVAEKLIKKLEDLDKPVYQAYLAGTEILMAKHVSSPFTKYKYFNKGKNRLEKLVKKYPNDAEIRLIRYSIQTKLPSFLNYNDKLKTDKAFILKKIKTMNNDQKELKKFLQAVLKRL